MISRRDAPSTAAIPASRRVRQRTDEGIERAKRQGKKFGRPERLDDGQKRKIAEFYAQGKTIPELAAEYECGVGTIWRALNGPFEVRASA